MLTNIDCKNAQRREKDYKLADGEGMFLLVKANGSKHWRLKYHYQGREKSLAIGPYPLVMPTEARDLKIAAKRLLRAGIDPVANKQNDKRSSIRNSQNSFKSVAIEWHDRQLGRWSKNHGLNIMKRFEIDIFPFLGARPIADIDAPEVLEVLRRIEKRGALDVAARVKQICGQVFRYGIATGKCKRDHTADLKNALATRRTKHYPAINIKELPDFLAALETNKPRLYERTRLGIRLLMLTFVRTSELIKATWDEFDLENGVWEIPKERMKMREEHLVPLSRQAIAILKELKQETEHLNVNWIFPGQIKPRNHMSNNTILFAIGRLGYKGKMTGHGFRALGMSTIKERLGYPHEIVNLQLAHRYKSKVDQAYSRATFIEDRTLMMQEWADYIDTVESGGKIVFANFKQNRAIRNVS